MQYTYTKPDPEATHHWHISKNEIRALILQRIADLYGPIPDGKVHIMFPSYPCNDEDIKISIRSTDVISRKKDK